MIGKEDTLNKLKIVLNEKTFMISKLNNVSSGYYVQIDDVSFPNKQWNDLSVAVIEMWLEVLNRHLLGLENTSILNFMDGDYEIRLHNESSFCSLASFVEPDGRISYSTTVDLLYLARQLLSVSSKIINVLLKNTSTYHTSKLEEQTATLRATVHKLSKTRGNSC